MSPRGKLTLSAHSFDPHNWGKNNTNLWWVGTETDRTDCSKVSAPEVPSSDLKTFALSHKAPAKVVIEARVPWLKISLLRMTALHQTLGVCDPPKKKKKKNNPAPAPVSLEEKFKSHGSQDSVEPGV